MRIFLIPFFNPRSSRSNRSNRFALFQMGSVRSNRSRWSLLSWTGPLAYVGQRTIIDPDGRWLPGTMEVVDAWIEEVLGA
jgi:hypothetical protein